MIYDKYKLSVKDKVLLVDVTGSWTIKDIDNDISKFKANLDAYEYESVQYDFLKLNNLDTAGAFILSQALRVNPKDKCDWIICNSDEGYSTLMKLVIASISCSAGDKKRRWYDILTNIGKGTDRFFYELVVGSVIAYMGVNLLAAFGASIFMVDLVGISVLRELAPIIVAVLVAGRSNSSFTAQIGAMKMRQEIDALKVIGLDAYETLVFPRALACIIALPILTFLGMMSGIFSGMLIAWMTMDISPILFLTRLNEAVGIESFWVGLVKTPFFAIVIAIIGCRQGLAVSGSVESLGSRTTQSVVQSIFAVIALNAIFAILFYQMGV